MSELEKVVARYESGETLQQIGESLGISRRTVSRRITRVGGRIRTKREASLGRRNSQWRGGKASTKGGYIVLLGQGTRVLEHRHIMSGLIGRPLTDDEVVHHKNGIVDDNRPENLLLCTVRTHGHQHKRLEPERWALLHDRCAVCGRTDRRHSGDGLCTACYMNRRSLARRGGASAYDDQGNRVFTEEHRRRLSEASFRRYGKTVQQTKQTEGKK